MRKLTSILTIVLASIMMVQPVSACWVYLSVDEMASQAELIAIVQYRGEYREVLEKDGYGNTLWKVYPTHILKGESISTFEVKTGGSSNAKVEVSTDYKLTNKSNAYQLLILRDNGDSSYSPITPRGIFELTKSDNGILLSDYDFSSMTEETDAKDILNLVIESDIIFIENDFKSSENDAKTPDTEDQAPDSNSVNTNSENNNSEDNESGDQGNNTLNRNQTITLSTAMIALVGGSLLLIKKFRRR